MYERTYTPEVTRWADMHDRSDDALIAAVPTDVQAYEMLYRRYLGQVYRYVLARAASPQEAEDMAQEIFLRAYEGLKKYESRGLPFIVWLMRIARNHAIDVSRKRRTAVPWEHLPEALHPITDSDLPGAVARNEEYERVGRLLMELSVEKRELLSLRFAAGLKVHEIALVVGRSPAAVEKSLQRTLHTLKERYRDS